MRWQGKQKERKNEKTSEGERRRKIGREELRVHIVTQGE